MSESDWRFRARIQWKNAVVGEMNGLDVGGVR